MPELVPISYRTHSEKLWVGPSSFSFARNTPVAAVGFGEMSNAALHLPIGFIKQHNRFFQVAIMGFKPDQNLLVDKAGKWLSDFRPIRFRTHPFTLAPTKDGELVLCMRGEDGFLARDGAGYPFFEASGELTSILKQIADLLVEEERSQHLCNTLISRLDELGVLTPWDISYPTQEGMAKAEGLFRIDEIKFNSLSDSDYLSLRATGAITMAFCHMISTQHMLAMVKRAEEQMRESTDALFNHPMELDFSRFSK